jgi:hypothetical protein
MADDYIQIESILRSINILYDADKPERIAHFHPTSKATVLIESLFGLTNESDYLISAPYGSGKSLTATYILHAVENNTNSKDVLKKIGQKIRENNTKLGDFLLRRVDSDHKGIVITMQGHTENIAAGLKKGLEESLQRRGIEPFEVSFGYDFSDLEKALNSIKGISYKLKKSGFDRIVLLWDEFGRHIETLLSEGYPSRLNEIQTIAEFASRFSKVPLRSACFSINHS